MRILKILVLMASIVLILACNFPTSAPATQPSSPTPTNAGSAPVNTATAALPTFTTVPTIASTATIAPTPSVPQVTPINAGVNCRSGPDVSYTAVSSLGLGQVAQIAGRNNDSSWWYVRDPSSPGSFCWVSASVVTTAGSLVGIPIIAPPAAIVTQVTANASVGTPVFCGGPNAIMFSGQITTNGPAKVQFQWEITGDKQNTTAPQTINFKSAGTKDAPDPGAYSADCGNYTITLHVLSPNDISGSKNFKVKP
jgi:hypothetical protein